MLISAKDKSKGSSNAWHTAGQVLQEVKLPADVQKVIPENRQIPRRFVTTI